MHPVLAQHIETFLKYVEPWEQAYLKSGFKYFAFKEDGVWRIQQGRISLSPIPPAISFKYRDALDWRFGHLPISDLGISIRELIAKLLANEPIETSQGRILFICSDTPENFVGTIESLEPEFNQESTLCQMTIRSPLGDSSFFSGPLDRHLRASHEPYLNTQELLHDFGFIDGLQGTHRIEINAHRVIEIDDNSKVEGTNATVDVLLHSDLPIEQCRIGYRVISQNGVRRGSMSGNELQWTSRTDNRGFSLNSGKAELSIPTGSSLQVFASYEGVSQHQTWRWDPSTSPNLRRAIWEGVDSSTRNLQEAATTRWRPGMSSKDLRDLETAVATILWMLGFSPIHLCMSSMQENPDILAITPGAKLLVIECTSGMPNENDKLAKLKRRASIIRSSLDQSGFQHITSLPVIVSGLPESEAMPHFEIGEKLGIVVLTQETITNNLDRTRFWQDADKIFDELMERLNRPPS